MGKFINHANYIPVDVPADSTKVAVGSSLRKVYIISDEASVPKSFVVEEGSNLDVCLLVLPATSDLDINLDVFIEGERSSAELSGVFILNSNQKASLKVNMHHTAPNCNSNQLFNCIATDSASFDFLGTIIVAPDAQNTESYQSNHNILLSDDASIQTKPQLEIYADQVKCSHGATTGRLNEEEQFYMRSRGIPENEAKILQMISFISPIYSHFPEDEREKLVNQIEDAIRKL